MSPQTKNLNPDKKLPRIAFDRRRQRVSSSLLTPRINVLYNYQNNSYSIHSLYNIKGTYYYI